MSDERLAQSIVEFHRLREEITQLTKKRESMKKHIATEMDRRGRDRLRSGRVAVTRRLVQTQRLVRENMPEEVYQRYAVPTEYYTYTVKIESRSGRN